MHLNFKSPTWSAAERDEIPMKSWEETAELTIHLALKVGTFYLSLTARAGKTAVPFGCWAHIQMEKKSWEIWEPMRREKCN